jgi:hypothetical protein
VPADGQERPATTAPVLPALDHGVGLSSRIMRSATPIDASFFGGWLRRGLVHLDDFGGVDDLDQQVDASEGRSSPRAPPG